MSIQLTVVKPIFDSPTSQDETIKVAKSSDSLGFGSTDSAKSPDSAGAFFDDMAPTGWLAITPDGYQVILSAAQVCHFRKLRPGQQVVADMEMGKPTNIRIS